MIDTVVFCFLGIIFLLCVYPFYYSIILSFNDGLDAARGGIAFWPRKFTLDNYSTFLQDSRWISAFFLTLGRTVLGTVVTTFFTALVAYGMSFENLVGRKVYFAIIILCMYFNGGLIPYYMTLKTVGLTNHFMVYIIPQALNLFYVIVGISFFQGIPGELHESAKLDGASEIDVLLRIVLPISKPMLATIAIFSGVNHWNSWFDSAYFVQDKSLRTLGYLLMEVINKSTINSAASGHAVTTVTPMAIQVTAMVISTVPIMIIYPFMQRYFVTGMTLGAVKG